MQHHERYHSNRLELFEPSNEDTQILNQYANPYQYEKPAPDAFKRNPLDMNMLPFMMKHEMKSFMPNDFYGSTDIIKDAMKQSSSCLDSKKDDAILKDFDIDIDEFDSKIIDNPYDYIEPNFFLGNNVDKQPIEQREENNYITQDKDDLHSQCANVADQSPSAIPSSVLPSNSAYQNKNFNMMNFDTDYHVKEINPNQDLGLWRQQSRMNELVYGQDQQRLFNQGSIHDAHDQTQAEVIQQPGPNVEVIISDPMNMANQYSIGTYKFSQLLRENGRIVQARSSKNKAQLQELVRKFCSAKELMFVTEGDAREIVNSGVIEIVKIPLKGKAITGEYNCLICPLTQHHTRGFKRKEDIKRHYQLHFKFQRFLCKHCQYGNARTDHIKLHIIKCHPDKNPADYERN